MCIEVRGFPAWHIVKAGRPMPQTQNMILRLRAAAGAEPQEYDSCPVRRPVIRKLIAGSAAKSSRKVARQPKKHPGWSPGSSRTSLACKSGPGMSRHKKGSKSTQNCKGWTAYATDPEPNNVTVAACCCCCWSGATRIRFMSSVSSHEKKACRGVCGEVNQKSSEETA